MSLTEILDALPKLSFDELQLVDQRILELQEPYEIVPSPEFSAAIEEGIRSSETEPLAAVETVRAKLAEWVRRPT